ncbi:DUF3592 domain-containing protein [Nitratireductor basaltis]|uniref:DUF3592 domain-containing protein n=1 Tax=Nitratireductor basaltis TaxID=472175 RepID=A0A084U7T7_9HYPH|nr:DUF3592 domain-containing protein [Nitratireductor basaltis]KFB09023.1 hypothetical protein EL18_00037 [Nitratireductor basaltis]
MLHTALIRLNMTQLYLLRTGSGGKRQASWRVWVLIFLLPVLFLGTAAALAWESYAFISSATRTTGEVVRVYAWEGWNPWDGKTTDYSPVFRYRFSDTEMTEASTGQSSPNWNFAIGSQHEIFFTPDEKRDVRQKNFEQLWALPAAIGGIGMVLLIPSAIVAWFVLRWLRGGEAKAGSYD